MRTKLRLLLCSIAAPVLLGSCATRVFCSSDAPTLPARVDRLSPTASDEDRMTAYTKDYRSNSGFHIRRVASVKVQPSCGMDLMATVCTLGLIPHSGPHPVHVIVDGDQNGISKTHTYRLSLHRTTSIWDRFIPASHDHREIARAILQAVDRDQQLPLSSRPGAKRHDPACKVPTFSPDTIVPTKPTSLRKIQPAG